MNSFSEEEPIQLFLQKQCNLRSDGKQLIADVIKKLFRKECPNTLLDYLQNYNSIFVKRIVHKVIILTKSGMLRLDQIIKLADAKEGFRLKQKQRKNE